MPCRCSCSLGTHHRPRVFKGATFWWRCNLIREKVHFRRWAGTATIVGDEGIPFINIHLGTCNKDLWPIYDQKLSNVQNRGDWWLQLGLTSKSKLLGASVYKNHFWTISIIIGRKGLWTLLKCVWVSHGNTHSKLGACLGSSRSIGFYYISIHWLGVGNPTQHHCPQKHTI